MQAERKMKYSVMFSVRLVPSDALVPLRALSVPFADVDYPKSGSSGGPNSAMALSALEYSQNASIAEQFNEMTNSHYFSNVCSDNSRI